MLPVGIIFSNYIYGAYAKARFTMASSSQIKRRRAGVSSPPSFTVSLSSVEDVNRHNSADTAVGERTGMAARSCVSHWRGLGN